MKNVPNILTVIRILMVPLFLFAMFYKIGGNGYSHYLIATIIFAVASFTDFLDGNIARKYNIISNFGKIADPIADKMLVCAALISLVVKGLCNVWLVVVIMFREVVVTLVRMAALKKGIVIPAGISGKVKTVVQMLMIITAIMFIYSNEKYYSFVGSDTLPIDTSVNIVIGISAFFTVLSGVIYTVKAKDIFKVKKD